MQRGCGSCLPHCGKEGSLNRTGTLAARDLSPRFQHFAEILSISNFAQLSSTRHGTVVVGVSEIVSISKRMSQTGVE